VSCLFKRCGLAGSYLPSLDGECFVITWGS
jgi:hypothetical protein